MLESITNHGNGTYYYIDSFNEARKVLLEDLTSTLVTVTQDTKVQIEFNPAQVGQYRLIGYANRLLKAEDFDNDAVDAGGVGSGHQVTALYEIRPAVGRGGHGKVPAAPGLRYQERQSTLVPSGDLATVALRYQPGGSASRLVEQPVRPSKVVWRDASADQRFAASVGLFGMLLRESEMWERGRRRQCVRWRVVRSGMIRMGGGGSF